jgi:hypothetical protein
MGYEVIVFSKTKPTVSLKFSGGFRHGEMFYIPTSKYDPLGTVAMEKVIWKGTWQGSKFAQQGSVWKEVWTRFAYGCATDERCNT